MQGPTPCASHPRTLQALLSLRFIAAIPHSAIPSPTHRSFQQLQSSHQAHPPPSFHGKIWLKKTKPTVEKDAQCLEPPAPGFPREAIHLPLAPGTFPHTQLCLVSPKARNLASVHLNLYFRVTHRRALDRFCLDFHSSRNFPRLVLVMREKQGSKCGERLSFPIHTSNPTFLPYSEVTIHFGHTCPMLLHLWDWFILWECQYLQLSLIRFPDPSRPGLDLRLCLIPVPLWFLFIGTSQVPIHLCHHDLHILTYPPAPLCPGISSMCAGTRLHS